MKTAIGYIFFPENPTEIIQSVRLIDNENDIQIEFSGLNLHFENIGIILGVFNGYGEVTLINCCMIHREYGEANNVIKLSVEYLLKNTHIHKPEKLLFSKAIVNIPALFEWLKLKIVNNQLFSNKTLKIEYPADIKFEISSDFDLTFSFWFDQSTRYREIKLKESACLEICAKNNKLSLWDILEILERFKKFILFTTNKSPDDEWITFYDNDNYFEEGSNKQLIPIEFSYEKNATQTKQLSYSPSLRYIKIKDTLLDALSFWFNKKDLFDSIDLILEKSINSGLSRENYFLNTCFALEIFHRRFRNNNLYTPSEFKELKRKVLQNITDESICNLLSEKFAHVNEPSFKDRLNSFRDDFVNVLSANQDVDEYIRRIVKTRNSLVHRSSNKNIFIGIDLFYASKYIESIVKLNIFKELGIDSEEINFAKNATKDQLRNLYNLNKRLQTSVHNTVYKP